MSRSLLLPCVQRHGSPQGCTRTTPARTRTGIEQSVHLLASLYRSKLSIQRRLRLRLRLRLRYVLPWLAQRAYLSRAPGSLGVVGDTGRISIFCYLIHGRKKNREKGRRIFIRRHTLRAEMSEGSRVSLVPFLPHRQWALRWKPN
jgi:hypothetical protein